MWEAPGHSTRSLFSEAPRAITPASIETPLLTGMTIARKERQRSLIPMGRLGTVNEVAALVESHPSGGKTFPLSTPPLHPPLFDSIFPKLDRQTWLENALPKITFTTFQDTADDHLISRNG